MEIHLTPGLQEKLAQTAAKQRRDPAEMVETALAGYLADEAQFENVEIWKEEDWLRSVPQLEIGFLPFKPEEPIDTVQARRDIQEFKDRWRKQGPPVRKLPSAG